MIRDAVFEIRRPVWFATCASDHARGEQGEAPKSAMRAGLALATILCFVTATTPATRAAAPLAVESDRFMVVSSQHLAAEAGAEILRAGGNAIDAAVAVGYAEAVTDPCCGNIGGGGFLVTHLADGRDIFINFRETAPAAARPDMYLDASGTVIPGASLRGWRAAGVPGTVLGLDTALTRYGSLPRSTVMAPAIRLAREGFVSSRAPHPACANKPRWRESSCAPMVHPSSQAIG